MKPWHEGLPETKQIVVFPPLGKERAFNGARERIEAYLRREFPEMQFEFEEYGLHEDASVMPMCGTVGGANSRVLAPPSEFKLREIERELHAFKFAAISLS
ncbi:hypothetical protein AB6806_27300 [Bosea sp. RCC_152_1]|uniref:hypothetical protein n=1 Tax=Bosea sp. RCC_152_1 TaxID=3239228 RepID=UPI003524666D